MQLSRLVGTPLRSQPSSLNHNLDVVVSPGAEVTAFYRVSSDTLNLPISSVTLAFAVAHNDVVERTLSGTDINLPPGFSGQLLSGDLGIATEILPTLGPNRVHVAILSGVQTDQHTGNQETFFFYKEYQL